MIKRWQHRRKCTLYKRLYRETRYLETYKTMMDFPTYIRAVHRVMRHRMEHGI